MMLDPLFIILWVVSTLYSPVLGSSISRPQGSEAAGKAAVKVPTTSTPKLPPKLSSFSKSDLAALAPYTHFAGAAYCGTAKVKNWSCGQPCKALPGFKVSLIGGDGAAVPLYFVGYYPSMNSVVVGHQGTDPHHVQSILNDINAIPVHPDAKLFPGLSKNIKVHDGFHLAHRRSASKVLAEVKRLMAKMKTSSVIVAGHSLGAAISELEAMFLTLNIPSAKVTAVTFGTPRVGNLAWVKLFDSKVPNFKRINNKKDVVPIVPGRHMGYVHPHGEIHILGLGKAVACPGNDDATDPQCQIKSVPNILKGNVSDHMGPYEGIMMGSAGCA